MVKTMRSVDFNAWMTMIGLTRQIVCSDIFKQYITIDPESILPEFPRDLAKFKKPSIIIQKIATDISDIGFSNGYMGQVYDEESNQYLDVNGRYHKLTFQYDIFANNNNDVAILESAIVDEILGGSNIDIYDYVSSLTNPAVIGVAKLTNDIDITPLDAAENYDYRTIIRFYLDIVQSIISVQDTVDLSKWIKISQVVKQI